MNTQRDPSLADTIELPAPGAEPGALAGVGGVRVDCAGLSDRGRVRENNEDHFHVSRVGRFLETLHTNAPGLRGTMFEEEGHGMVVADGMGGAAAGELASNLAIHTLLHLVMQTPDWIFSSQPPQAKRVMERMAERFGVIDDKLLDEAKKNSRLRGMGTTMTLACNVADCLVLAHIGDSRAYLYRAGKLQQLTHDHTVAQALVDQGYLKRTTDATKQLQHTLMRALGGTGHSNADVDQLRLLDGDVIVLCTDGLTDMLRDAEIAAVLSQGASAADTCKVLVDQALANGGSDNVTVVVARYLFSRGES